MAKPALVVDDTAFMRMALKNHLLESNYEIIDEGLDGREAIEIHKKHKPDLVTMDITNINRDGIETTRRLLPWTRAR